MADVAIHLFGADSAASAESISASTGRGDATVASNSSGLLGNASLRSILDCLAASQQKLSVFCDVGNWNWATAQPLLDRFARTGAAVGFLADSELSDLTFVWTALPALLASVVVAPESRGAVVLNRRQLSEPTFRDVAAPLHDLIVRTLQVDPAGVVLLAGETTTASPLPAKHARLPELAPQEPGRSSRWLAAHLESSVVSDALPSAGPDSEQTALRAGLWQVYGDLDRSHSLSQSIEGEGRFRNGDYWHGIMHRREPDWGNAKYWFRRVGTHPCFEELAPLAAEAFAECESSAAQNWNSRCAGRGHWNSAAFVDLCEAATTGLDTALAQTARRIQWAEMLLLLRHSAKMAAGNQ